MLFGWLVVGHIMNVSPAHSVCGPNIEAYIKVAGLEGDPKTFLFRTVAGKTGRLTPLPLSQADAYLRLGTTHFAPPALPLISRTAANWKSLSRSRRMSHQGRQGFTTGAMTN
jgi:hypothetical protein